MGKTNRTDDSGLTTISIILLAIIALPFVGFCMLTSAKDEEHRALGIVLMVVGIVLWILVGLFNQPSY